MPIALSEGVHPRRASDSDETPPAIVEAWRCFKSTRADAARNQLVAYYMRTHVRPIAARIHAGLPNQVDVDDLVQQGYLGLITAMDRFDADRETRFETFSRRRIAGAIQDYLRSIDPVPRLTRTRFKCVQVLLERFRKQHGRPPTDEELRPFFEGPEQAFRQIMSEESPAAIVPFSSAYPDGPAADGGAADAMHAFEDHSEPDPVVTAERGDLQRWITRGLEQRDRLIIILYYYEQMTMHEIGGALGISESRVSQRLESILACLRSRLHGVDAEHEFVLR